MTTFRTRAGLALALFAVAVLATAGCGPKGEVARDTARAPEVAQNGGKGDPGKAADAEDHSGWWCDEHGLPEEVCDLCSRKYRAAEKAKGNWCEHGRVKTSCFTCSPGVQAKYAAEYQAKFGKAPPPTAADEKKAKDAK